MKGFLLSIALILNVCGRVAFAATPLACGVAQTGSLDTGTPSVTFSISVSAANAPETIIVRVALTGSLQQPNLVLADVNNVPIKPGSLGPLLLYTLPAATTYNLTLSSAGQGSYQIAYVPTNRPCSNAALGCGAAVKGALDLGQMRTYQFNGKQGDPVLIQAIATGGDQGASLQLLAFDASGVQASVFPVVQAPRAFSYTLASDSVTFVAVEASGSLKLNYAMSVLDLKGSCSATSISCGSALDGSIGDTLALGLYSINAAANDVYQLRLVTTDTSGGLQASVAVFDPQGKQLQPVSSSDPTRFVTPPLAAGQYLVMVSDGNGTGTGKYAMSLARLNNPCSAQPLGCGTSASGQISGALRFNTYALSAQAGDVYVLRTLKTNAGGNFAPVVEVYGPDGSRVVNSTTSNLGSVSFPIAATGTYSMLFSDSGGTQSGTYTAWVARVNRPCDSGSTGLTCGSPASGGISQPLQAGIYSYPTAPGDAFTVRLIDTGGSLQSALQVYAPNTSGQPLPAASGNTKAVDVTGSPGGPYTILVTDQSLSPQTGTFAIEAIGTKGTCAASPPQGQSVSGLVSGPAPFSAYTFAASQGEPLLLRLASSTPGFTANMDLYDPAGRRMGSSTFRLPSASPAPATGNYTVVVGASAPRTAGSYAFSWQLLDQPAATPLGCGQTVAGAFSSTAQFSYYTVSASDGDLLKLVLTRLPATVNAQVELFNSSGVSVKSSATEIDQKVSAGNYVVLVSPATATAESGGFALALQKPNNPCSAVNLACGQTILHQVTAPGQLDSYTFSGNAGDQVAITVTPRLGNISPVTELYDQSGNAVLNSPAATTLNATLAAAGQYTLTVHDKTGAPTGSYRVGLQHSNTPCPEDDTQKPTVTLLHPTGGEVIAGGTVYQIAWQSDDNVAVTSHAIRLSTDGGKTFGPLPGGPGSLSGIVQSYSWTVPADVTPTRTAVLQVTATDKGGNSQSAASDLVTLIGSGFTPNESVTYSYDPLNRIVQATYGDGRTIYYNYDAAGNLVNIVVP